jgi:hypothetical protein
MLLNAFSQAILRLFETPLPYPRVPQLVKDTRSRFLKAFNRAVAKLPFIAGQ